VPGTPIICDDGNLCTDDVCSGGSCQFINNAAPCNDGNPCTIDDHCSGGGCTGTPRSCPPGTSCDPRDGVCRACIRDSDCNDNNPCTNDVCTAGDCQHTANANPCDDGLRCTTNDRCSSGTCTGTPAACTDERRCDPADGVCKHCFVNGECDDRNPCTDDACNAAFDCEFRNNTIPCDDANACTLGDVCSAGACVGTVVSCPTGQHCNPADGRCIECGTVADCDDHDACTEDACVDGLCRHTPRADRCDDGSPCTTDACDPSTGECRHEPRCTYADVAPPGGNCVVNVDDVLCGLDGFRRASRCPLADVFPCGGDGVIGMDDVLAILEAFQDHQPCPDPTNCR
jgi:hypothetical protein